MQLTYLLILLTFVLPLIQASGLDVYTSTAPVEAGAVSLPELVLQTGHSKSVESLVFGPDKSWFASGSFDNTIRIWDVETGRELRSLTGHSGVIRSLNCSPDGKWLASGSNDKTLRLWNLDTGKETRRFDNGDSPVDVVVFSPDGQLIAYNGANGRISVRDASDGREVQQLAGHATGVSALEFSPNGKLLASGGQDHALNIWNPYSGKLLRSITGFTDTVGPIRFSDSGDILAVGGMDKTVRLWSTSNWKKLGLLTTAGITRAVNFVNQHTVLTLDSTGEIKSWELEPKPAVLTTKQIAQREGDGESAAFSKDTSLAAVGSGAGTVNLVDLSTAKTIRVFDNHTVGYYGACFSNDGEWLGTAAFDNTVKLWDLRTGRNIPSLRGHTGRVTSVVFHPDARRVISASVDHTLRVWNITTGRSEQTLTGHSNSVSSLAVSKTGKFAVSGSADQTVGVWDLSGPSPAKFLKGHTGEVVSVAVSPDEQLIASASTDGTVRIWNVQQGKAILTIPDPSGEVDAVAFSPDGTAVASGGIDKKVKIWDTASGQLVRSLTGHDGKINSVSFSPDGTELASSSQDKTMRIWNVSNGTLKRTVSGHAGAVYSASYAADGRFLCTASDDGSIIIWRSQSGERVSTLISLKESDDWLVVTPDGFFDGSPVSWEQLAWRFDQNTFNVKPVEVFFNEFYSPGLLSDVLNGRKLPSNSNISQKDRRQPKITISIPDQSTARNVKVAIGVSQAPAGAKDVRLFRNGSLVKVWRGDVLKGNNQATLEATIPVVGGENRLTAYAFNNDDIKSSDSKIIVTGPGGKPRNGIGYLLAVGINKYSNPEFNLTYANADAEDFVQEMKRQQSDLKNFDDIKVISIKDEAATKENVLKAITGLASRIQPEDVLIIYFAGHGTAQDNRFYLIPHDLGYDGSRTALDGAGLQAIHTHGISDLELENAVEGLDAAQIVMVIDACNSGQVLEAEDKRLGPMNSKGLAQLAYEKGMYILTAAQSYQAAQEAARLGHGFLTYALVEEGLKTAAADRDPKDGQVLLREWLDFATQRVPEIQEDDIKSRQLEREKSRMQGNSSDIQRPRVFYRRETERNQLVVARP